MKSHLAKVSLALLSAAFLLGCQDQGSSPVGLGPEFNKPNSGNCGQVHCHGDDVVDDKTVTVELEGGMTGMVTGLKVFSDNDKKFSMNTGAQSTGTITTDFPAFGEGCTVENSTGTGEDNAVVTLLKSQLDNASIVVSDPSFGLFGLFSVRVDRTETKDRNNVLEINYDLAGVGPVILGWARRSPHPTVSEVSEDGTEVFTFTFMGGQIRVGEDEGQDRIRILCPGADVTVTVTR